MNEAVISVSGLGKRYRIGGRRDAYLTLRDSLAGAARRAAGRLFADGSGGRGAEDFWALRGVSFEVRRGEVVGIIGRNGAGKSTLLKVLSRITEPTEGRAVLRGRVGSLLEVGTGFHPELTGRENIYLSGAVLGMRKAEIDRQFDAIVAFAGVEKFLDTPIKRYSSGMNVRLGFAVAAHLDPEILLVDEVLAVGDADFQKKCLGKMGEVARGGRTVLFVSHNMAAVESLCPSALLLADGRVAAQGPTAQVQARYLDSAGGRPAPSGEALAVSEEWGVVLRGIDVRDDGGRSVSVLRSGKAGSICLRLECRRPLESLKAVLGVSTWAENARVCALASNLSGQQLTAAPPAAELICRMNKVPLRPGRYRLMVKLVSAGQPVFYLPEAACIEVAEGDFFGTGGLPEAGWGGWVLVEHEWRSERPAGE